jgi:hypothetical protein
MLIREPSLPAWPGPRQMSRAAMAATAACGTVTAARWKMAASGPVTSVA